MTEFVAADCRARDAVSIHIPLEERMTDANTAVTRWKGTVSIHIPLEERMTDRSRQARIGPADRFNSHTARGADDGHRR